MKARLGSRAERLQGRGLHEYADAAAMKAQLKSRTELAAERDAVELLHAAMNAVSGSREEPGAWRNHPTPTPGPPQ